jgi:hypothetical protein
MGYTTNFEGKFVLDTILDERTEKLLKGIATTRRMKRSIPALAKKFNISEDLALLKYGIDGEFYYNEEDFINYRENIDNTIIDMNESPSRQPSLWCQWYYSRNTNSIKWDGDEKFYNYVEWIEYIIEFILVPRKYKLSGMVLWQGEEEGDKGYINIINNKVKVVLNCSTQI